MSSGRNGHRIVNGQQATTDIRHDTDEPPKYVQEDGKFYVLSDNQMYFVCKLNWTMDTMDNATITSTEC
jgi:hypothetical protein